MKNLVTVLTGIVLILSSCSNSTKTTETNQSSESTTTSTVVNNGYDQGNYSGDYYQDKRNDDLAQVQRALNVRGVAISASIRAKVINNYNKNHSLAINTSQSSSTLESYSATTIPGIYLSKPIKSKILNIEQDQNPTFQAHSGTPQAK